MNYFNHLAITDKQAFLKARRQLQKENREQSRELVEQVVDTSKWASGTELPQRVWRSRDFLVTMTQEGAYKRLTINRTELDVEGDWKDGITWDQIQHIKNSIGFQYDWAVEVYPPKKHLVHVANMRHIFLLNEPPKYGWKKP